MQAIIIACAVENNSKNILTVDFGLIWNGEKKTWYIARYSMAVDYI